MGGGVLVVDFVCLFLVAAFSQFGTIYQERKKKEKKKRFFFLIAATVLPVLYYCSDEIHRSNF